MTLKKQSIIAILCVGVLFSCVPARKYEELKSKQTACLEENSALKAQNQGLEEKNKEMANDKKYNIIFLNFLACILTEYIFFLNNNDRGRYK